MHYQRAFFLATLVAALFLLGNQGAIAQIILQIDESTMEWELTGSDSGNPGTLGSSAFQILWNIDGSASGNFDVTQEPVATFGSSAWSSEISNNRGSLSGDFFFGDASFRLDLWNTGFDPGTITVSPIGGRQDYSALSPSARDWFEGLIGTEIPLINGTGFEGIRVEAVSQTVLLGDVDLSGAVNFLDIAPFIAVLSSDDFLAQADCDESGDVNFLDIAPFIAILSSN